MAEEYYDDSAGGGESAAPAPEAEATAEESNVAILPKSFFPGDKPLEPGNECTVKIEEVQEDQVLVSYSHSPQSSEAAAQPAPEMDEEMQGYMA